MCPFCTDILYLLTLIMVGCLWVLFAGVYVIRGFMCSLL